MTLNYSVDTTDWLTMANDFVFLCAMVLSVIVGLLVCVGLFFEVMNARYPERKIQKKRTNKRKWQELYRAPVSIAVIVFCFSGGLFSQAAGWALTPVELTVWTGPVFLLLSMVLYDTWFYWMHRLLHCKPFYRFHKLHHKSVTPTVWTNHHETLVEAILNQVFYLVIPFILPIPLEILVLQKIYDQVSGMLGHSGYEHFASPGARKPFPLASTVFHDQHHAYFSYNFAHTFSVWDRLMGTLHPEYDKTVKSFEAIKS